MKNSNYTILLVEADDGLAESLRSLFEKAGLRMIWCSDGAEVSELCKKNKPNIVIMDVVLPNKSGFDIISEIRETDKATPVILMDEPETDTQSEVKGYLLGAMNYIRKPVILEAILALIKTILYIPNEGVFYKVGRHRITVQNQNLQIDNIKLKLREKDSKVLSILLKYRNQILSKKTILLYTWNDDSYSKNNALDGAIHRLRKELAQFDSIRIKSIYGTGYMLEVI